MNPIPRIRAVAPAAALVGALAVLAAGTALAHTEHGHPAKIHAGSCEDLGAVAFALNGVGGTVDVDGKPVEQAEAVNPDTAYQVLRSETELDATIDDVLAAPHALMVYASDEDMSAISCGNLGGARIGDELAVGLAAVGAGGHSGIALFEDSADAPGTVTVTVYIGHALEPAGGHSGMDDGHDDGHDDGGHDHGDGHAEATPAA